MKPLPARIWIFRIDFLTLTASLTMGAMVLFSSSWTDQHDADICNRVVGCKQVWIKDKRAEADNNHFHQMWQIEVDHSKGRRSVDVLKDVSEAGANNVSWVARNLMLTAPPQVEPYEEGKQ